MLHKGELVDHRAELSGFAGPTLSGATVCHIFALFLKLAIQTRGVLILVLLPIYQYADIDHCHYANIAHIFKYGICRYGKKCQYADGNLIISTALIETVACGFMSTSSCISYTAPSHTSTYSCSTLSEVKLEFCFTLRICLLVPIPSINGCNFYKDRPRLAWR